MVVRVCRRALPRETGGAAEAVVPGVACRANVRQEELPNNDQRKQFEGRARTKATYDRRRGRRRSESRHPPRVLSRLSSLPLVPHRGSFALVSPTRQESVAGNGVHVRVKDGKEARGARGSLGGGGCHDAQTARAREILRRERARDSRGEGRRAKKRGRGAGVLVLPVRSPTCVVPV